MVGAEGLGVLLAHVVADQVNVDLGRGRAGMAEDALDDRLAHPAADQFGGQAVAEAVGSEGGLDPRGAAAFPHDRLDRAGADRRAGLADPVAPGEGREVPDAAVGGIAPGLPVGPESCAGLAIEVNSARRAALAAPDEGRSLIEVDLLAAEPTELRDAHAGPGQGEEEGDDLAAAQLPLRARLRRAGLDVMNHPFEVGRSDARRWRAEAADRLAEAEGEFLGREVGVAVSRNEVGVELPDGGEVG